MPTSALTAFLICLLVLWLAVSFSEPLRHWFVIPVFLCGILILPDLIDWMRGRIELFDPVGLIGFFGTLHFFAAPLLHVFWDRWPLYLPNHPADWRSWLGWMGILNALGLVFYRLVRSWVFKKTREPKKVWVLGRSRFFRWALVGLGISGAAAALVLLRFGGVSGYIQSYVSQQLDPFEGLGLIFALSDAFSVIVAFVFAVKAHRGQLTKSWIAIGIALLIVIALRLVLGGFRGSRNNVIWGAFWAVGITHFWVRKIPRVVAVAGVIVVFLFAYLFAFYKNVGSQAFSTVRSTGGVASLQRQTLYDAKTVLLLDIGRSAIQAYLLYRTEDYRSGYRLALGRTYIGDVAGVVPRAIWPSRPPSKTKEATEIVFGTGSYRPGYQEATYVYGIAGEGILNFGWVAVPFAFAVLGGVVGWVRRKLHTIHPEDARWLLFPLMPLACMNLFQLDFDNVMIFLFQGGMLPFLVVYLSSKKAPRSAIGTLDAPREALPG